MENLNFYPAMAGEQGTDVYSALLCAVWPDNLAASRREDACEMVKSGIGLEHQLGGEPWCFLMLCGSASDAAFTATASHQQREKLLKLRFPVGFVNQIDGSNW